MDEAPGGRWVKGIGEGTVMPVVLYLLAVGTFAIGTDAFIFAGLLPEVSSDLGIEVETAGQLVTVFSFAYAVLAPISASITSSWPRKRIITLALLTFIAGNVVSALSGSFEVMVLGRIIAAAGASSFTPHAIAIASENAPEGRRGTALSIVVGGLTVATALGVPIGTFVGSTLGWRATLWLVVVLGVFALLAPLLLGEVKAPARHTLRERLAPLRSGIVALVLATTFLALVSEHLVYTYISAVFDEATGGNGKTLSVLLLIFGIGAVIGNAIAGPAVDRWGNKSVLFIALAVMAADLLLLPLTTHTLPAAVVAVLVWGIASWMYLVPQQHRLLELSTASGPFTVSLNSSALYLGIAVGGALGGATLSLVGPVWLGVVGGLVGVLAVASGWLSYRVERTPNTVTA
ncbi:putative arabinose efflux permease, MFS family [Actinokineospora globicatena]|uniref:MFS transporter n=2 Tax=Actinokineospora globicatena TaxID=103729 RepID=A0A9W6QHC6_9PSEU|nr:putative arabinose efflux permease, MFS family [Actinokineospora globicatena]GLW79469.1 MFS transporter [Actinokineospora globicatena]GLW90086.1 MFS transporter [Actinokineospora globicatena]